MYLITLNLYIPGAHAETSSRVRGNDGYETEGVRGLKALGVRDLTYRLAYLACTVQSSNPRVGISFICDFLSIVFLEVRFHLLLNCIHSHNHKCARLDTFKSNLAHLWLCSHASVVPGPNLGSFCDRITATSPHKIRVKIHLFDKKYSPKKKKYFGL